MKLSDDLRQSVLQAAMEGKLTKKMKEDGNADDLLEAISSEKAKLIKEKKIKKTKLLPEISEDEIPFDIPENWRWVRLGDIVYNHGQKKPTTPFSYVDVGTLDNINYKLNDEENIIEPDKAPSRARKIIKEGDIIYSTVRPYLHNICIINKKFSKEPIASTAFAVMACYSSIFNKYLFYYLLSPSFDLYANSPENSKGVAYPAINDKTFYNGIIPLPSLAEQHRIVEKVDVLMAEIDELEKKENELEKLRNDFPEDMKASLLQAAMQGKLTEQLPSDGSTETLFDNILSERESLIKAKKIKKAKKLPDIKELEIPYDIPKNWKWVRLNDVGDWGAGATPLKTHTEYYVNGDVPWLLTGDLNDSYINHTNKFITKKALQDTSVSLKPKGSVLIAMYGATIGKLGILNIEATTNQACCACIPFHGVYNKFLFYFLMSHKNNFIKQGEGGAQPNISRVKIVKTVFPLPPLEEQHRIVEKLDELLPLCETLKED